jgi:AraC-like DNA-binding protein
MGIPETDICRSSAIVSDEEPVAFSQSSYLQPTSARYDMHYGLELGIVLSGRMRRFYREGERNVSEGDAWLCGAWEPHGFEVRRSCRCVVFVIWPPLLGRLHFAEQAAHDWLQPFRAPPPSRPRIPANRRARFLEMVTNHIARMSLPDALRQTHLQLLVLNALLEVTHGWKAPSEASRRPTQSGEWIRKAIDLTHERHAGVTVQEAARLCAMDRNRFSRLFQDAMGIRFRDFSLRYRLSGAADQLRNSALPIKAIVEEWGFTDHSHLLRLFRQHYGATPAQYRISHSRIAPDRESRPGRAQD